MGLWIVCFLAGVAAGWIVGWGMAVWQNKKALGEPPPRIRVLTLKDGVRSSPWLLLPAVATLPDGFVIQWLRFAVTVRSEAR